MSDGYHLADETIRGLHDDPIPAPEIFTAEVTAVTYPTCKIRKTGTTQATNQLVGMIVGSPVKVGDRALCCWVGGEPFVIGPIANNDGLARTLSVPFYSDQLYIDEFDDNSASVASNTSTSVYTTNQSGSFDLPDGGDWVVVVFAFGMYSHSAEAGNVRVRTVINGDNGEQVNCNVNITTTRTVIPSSHRITGVNGGTTVTFSQEYRPNSTGTATAGGGVCAVFAYRNAI